MLLTQSLFFAFACWQATPALAASLPPSHQELDYTLDLNVTENDLAARDLERRKDLPITMCPILHIGDYPYCPYSNGEAAIDAWLPKIAEQIKELSDYNTCTRISGEEEEFNWRFESHTEDSRWCDTSASLETIQGAIRKTMRDRAYWICEQECFRMSHGSSWRGSLLVGRKDTWDMTKYCGDSLEDLQFATDDRCISGGNKDL